jgi:hypothetical protein
VYKRQVLIRSDQLVAIATACDQSFLTDSEKLLLHYIPRGRSLFIGGNRKLFENLLHSEHTTIRDTDHSRASFDLQEVGTPPDEKTKDGQMRAELSLHEKDRWVFEFTTSYPAAAEPMKMNEIHDDGSYLMYEAGLNWDLRRRAGVFRLAYLTDNKLDDPCKVARAAPPWLTECEFVSLDLPVRVQNVFRMRGLKKVHDLSTLSVPALLKMQNLGQKSLGDILKALAIALDAGPPKVGTSDLRRNFNDLPQTERKSQDKTDQNSNVLASQFAIKELTGAFQESQESYRSSLGQTLPIEARKNMMIDKDHAARIEELKQRKVADQSALDRARNNLEATLQDIEAEIDNLDAMRASLAEYRDELHVQLGRTGAAHGADTPHHARAVKKPRQASGTLIRAYTAALTARPGGLTSAQVTEWIRRTYPEIQVGSVPAVLARGLQSGVLRKDDYGRFLLV